MAVKKGGMGRGFDSLFKDNSMDDSASAVTLKLNDIEPNKEQARKDFDDTSLSELAASIEKHGVLQPLLVRPLIGGGYQLIAGERRWRASRRAGRKEVPPIMKNLRDEDAAVISLIENLQREDLNPIEEANGFYDLITKFSLTQEQAAETVGKSRPAVANALRLLKLPAPVIELIRDGRLSSGHAKAIAGLGEESLIISAANAIVEKDLSVRETEKLVKSLTKPSKKKTETKTRRDSYYDEVELALNNSLGRKARVVTQGKKENGTLTIDFYDKADLKRIVKALGSLED